MKKKIRIVLFVLFIPLFISGCAAYRNYTAKIEIQSDDHHYILTTSESNFILFLPKHGFVPTDPIFKDSAHKNPRYFYFRNSETQLNVSGWFEANYMYPGQVKIYNDMVKKIKKNGYLFPPYDESHFRYDKWRVTAYKIPCDSEFSQNIRAHFYEDDTWIDLHISFDCDSEKSVKNILQFIDTIRIERK